MNIVKFKVCIFCKQKVNCNDTSHFNVCEDMELPCRNKCETNVIKRSELEEHISKCVNMKINCYFKPVGCKSIIKSQSMVEHINENIKYHNELICSKINKFGKEFVKITSKLEEFENTFSSNNQNKAMSEINKLKATISQLKENQNNPWQNIINNILSIKRSLLLICVLFIVNVLNSNIIFVIIFVWLMLLTFILFINKS